MTSSARDIVRQIAVISATSFMLVAAAVGSGALGGTPIQDAQDGALAADGSLLAPAGTAFSIWSVIYLGTIVYAIWQALPSQRSRQRQRRLGWWIAATAVLNGVWILLAQFANLPATTVGIVALLVALGITFHLAVNVPPQSLVDRVLIDGVVGVHLGWVAVATVANTTAWLTATGPASWASAGEVLGTIVLCVVGVIGVAIAVFGRGRIAPGLAIAWGLSWVAVGRLSGEPPSTPIGVTAIIVAVLVLLVSVAAAVAFRRSSARGAKR